MRKTLLVLALCMTLAEIQAQTVTHRFNDVSFSDALKYLQSCTPDVRIVFIYNDLEDFRVTADVRDASVEDAIQQLIGYYPIRMTIGSDRSIYVECTDKAERHLVGTLVDEKNRPVPYASVVLLHPSDSTVITYGVSNESGHFVIPFHQAEVIVAISSIGYKKIYRTCSEEDLGTVRMQSEEYYINGVVVKGEHILHYIDKSVHTFTDEQIAQARNVRDLLEHVQDLHINPFSNRISRINGSSVLLLLNGIRASDTDLKSIPPNKIVRVEYYDIPPARYSDAGTVVNVITKRLDNGINLGFDVTHAFTTGFGNDDAYQTYTSGYHQFGISYSINLREYSDDQGESAYKYQLAGKRYDYDEHHQRSFGYRTHYPILKYTYNRPKDLVLQVTAAPYFDSSHENRHVAIDLKEGSVAQTGEGHSRTHNRNFNPSVNTYLQKYLTNGQELDFDLTLTYSHSNYELDNEKILHSDGSSLLSDHQRQKSDKRSIYGAVAYSKEWDKTSLQTGYILYYGKSEATLSNVLSNFTDYHYSSASSNHFLYADLSGRLGRFMYRVGAHATHARTSNDDTHTSQWSMTPRLVLAVNPSKQTSLRFSSSAGINTPGISQLSNNTTLFLPSIATKGNPYLRITTNYTNDLNFRWDTSAFNLSLSAVFQYRHHPVSSYYTEGTLNGQPYLIGMQENANFSSSYGIDYELTYRPWPANLLTLSVVGAVHRQTADSPITGRFHNTYAPLWYTVTFRKGVWGATYSGNIVSHNLVGSYLNYGENAHNLFAFWQKNGWRVTAGCYWLFTRARYSSESVPSSLLQYHRKNWINDNASMFVLGISWDFTSGKDYRIQKKLDTTDHDSGRFL